MVVSAVPRMEPLVAVPIVWSQARNEMVAVSAVLPAGS